MTDRVIIELDGRVYALTVPEFSDDDVWKAIAAYDKEHGTSLWERLIAGDILGVNVPEYADVPEVDTEEAAATQEAIGW